MSHQYNLSNNQTEIKQNVQVTVNNVQYLTSGYLMKKISTIIPDITRDPRKTPFILPIVGALLGDARGVATEFINDKQEINTLYGNFINSNWINRSDSFRKNFLVGYGTDDTAQLYMVIDTFTHAFKQQRKQLSMLDAQNFINILIRWFDKGLVEINHPMCVGLGQLTHDIIKKHKFDSNNSTKTNLFEPAYKVWKSTLHTKKYKPQPNGAVMRTSVIGLVGDIDCVLHNTKLLTMLTHYDANCVVSSMMISGIINQLTYYDGSYDFNFDNIIAYVIRKIKVNLVKPFENEIIDQQNTVDWNTLNFYINTSQIEELKLNDPQMIGYTYKCMGSAIFALRMVFNDNSTNINDIFKYINMIVMEGGDADTNATVVGAVLGSYYARVNKANENKMFYDHVLFNVPAKLYYDYLVNSLYFIKYLK